MFAVRVALSREERLIETLQGLIQQGQLDPADINIEKPLYFLLNEAPTIPDAAYRFCRDEPGTHVILSGTGNPAHLQANVETFGRPPLSSAVSEQLRYIFRNVDSATGN
jgi:predicted aldo/keto reductase-like oxidoreductase